MNKLKARTTYTGLIPDHTQINLVATELFNLAADQQSRLDNQQPVSPIPLLWVALAEIAGLKIEIETGRIVDGPRTHFTVEIRQ